MAMLRARRSEPTYPVAKTDGWAHRGRVVQKPEIWDGSERHRDRRVAPRDYCVITNSKTPREEFAERSL